MELKFAMVGLYKVEGLGHLALAHRLEPPPGMCQVVPPCASGACSPPRPRCRHLAQSSKDTAAWTQARPKHKLDPSPSRAQDWSYLDYVRHPIS